MVEWKLLSIIWRLIRIECLKLRRLDYTELDEFRKLTRVFVRSRGCKFEYDFKFVINTVLAYTLSLDFCHRLAENRSSNTFAFISFATVHKTNYRYLNNLALLTLWSRVVNHKWNIKLHIIDYGSECTKTKANNCGYIRCLSYNCAVFVQEKRTRDMAW